MDEVWKAVEGYEGLYEVSSLGRIRSIDRLAFRKDGTKLHLRGSIKKQSIHGAGYFHVSVTKDGKTTQKLIHVLVARAFVLNPDGLPDVNHKDLNAQNNLPSNLEWVTHRQNIVHCRDGGRLNGYSNTKRRFKLQPDQVQEIRRRVASGDVHQRIADDYGVSRRHVGMIGRSDRWCQDFEAQFDAKQKEVSNAAI